MSPPLRTPRWTHVALPVADLERSLAWYRTFTPLVPVARFEDDAGRSAWLSHEDQAEPPLVLVLVAFHSDAGRPQPQLGPFAHLGIEVPTRPEVDVLAARAQAAGSLVMPPRDLPGPVGYVCMLADPDGNRVEISHGQRVAETLRERWAASGPGGAPRPTRDPP